MTALTSPRLVSCQRLDGALDGRAQWPTYIDDRFTFIAYRTLGYR